jgi:beta-aspartyl-peptidase (threonine type)
VMEQKPILVVHGGAWAMPEGEIAAHERGIANALAAGYGLLERGASAVDAVEAAVAAMEDDETFDAGRGSFLTQDGRVQMDALLMDGSNLRTGGVACVERLRNPIKAARLVLDESQHVYFVGTGAERFARQHGMALCDNMELVVPREQKRLYDFQQAEMLGAVDTTFSGEVTGDVTEHSHEASSHEASSHDGSSHDGSSHDGSSHDGSSHDGSSHEASSHDASSHDASSHDASSHDTVGAVAMDAKGNIAAGTSTGGTLNKAPGRVGDSSLIGCGCYADNLSAAVSLTGWGEPIMKLVLGKWAVDKVAAGMSPAAAAQAAIDYLYGRLGGHGGIILLGPDGRVGLAHNTPRLAWGIQTSAGAELGVTRNG